MKILLANLPWKSNHRWGVRAGSRWPHLKDQTEENYSPFPFYLAYSAALLKKHGFEVQIIDALAEKISYQNFCEKVLAGKPDLLVAETATVCLKHDLKFLEKFKGRFKIAVCGPDIHIAEKNFLQENKQVDFVLYGEYEATLLELANGLKNKTGLETVKGLLYRQGTAVRKNPARELIPDLDWLPWPERKMLPLRRYNDAPGDIPLPCASMWASRGCPYQCSFCLWPQVMYAGSSYRVRKITDVVDEMEYLVKELGFKSIYFDDDTWNIGRKRIIDFCQELDRRNFHVPWAIMARAENMDEELLEIMKRSGLFAVKYGVESSSQQILDAIGKGLDLKKAEEIIKYTKYLGIRTHLTFTFGLPGETQQTIKDTIDYALFLNPTSVQFSLATPFPGTKFYRQMDEKGYLLTKDLEKFDGNHSSVIKTENLTAGELEKAKQTAYAHWNAHNQLRRKKIIFKPKPLREKLMLSLREKGIAATIFKIARFFIARIFILPSRVRSFLNSGFWIIEEEIFNGDLRIKFGEGQVRVFWKDVEISKGIGLTTSFYYGERWHDSSQANWKLEKNSAAGITVKLNWDDVPVRQVWEIKISADQAIDWKSSLQVERPVQLLEYKAGVMIQDAYQVWKDDLGVGNFPALTQWEEIELYNSSSRMLGAKHSNKSSGTELPELELTIVGEIGQNTYPQIQNTDARTKARILQMRRLKIEQFDPGFYPYFELCLKIKKEVLVPQSVADYKKRVPLNFVRKEISVKGFWPVFFKMIKKIHPRILSEHYLDILGVLDGSCAYKGPYCAQIDLTNDCNNDCIGCWCNSPLLKENRIKDNVKQQQLPPEVVKRTIDELHALGTKEIYFAGGGEPFMYPKIMEILAHVKAKGLRCYVNTNFTLVTEDMVKQLVELGVDNLVVSIWAGTPKTYQLTHPNKSEEMFYQLKGMLKLLNSLKRDKPKVNIYNVISNLNYRELEAMVEFALAVNADSLEFTVIDTMPGATDTLILSPEQRQEVTEACGRIKKLLDNELKGKIQVLQFDQFIRRVAGSEADSAKYDKEILEEMPCYVGWLFTRILADGNVNFCLKAHRIPVGSIYAHSFGQIWNSRKQQEFRKRALCSSRDDVFFSFIGNDPDSRTGCFKSCDDLARNINMHKKIQSLTSLELRFLKLLLLYKKIKRSFFSVPWRRTLNSQIQRIRKTNSLQKNGQELIFNDEGVKILSHGRELTQGVGLTVSICVFGLWYDSSKANWRIKKHTESELVLENSWNKIPVSQEWTLKFAAGGIIDWQVLTRSDSKLEIEEYKASLMLRPEYRSWEISGQKGKFPLAMNWNEAKIEAENAQAITILKQAVNNAGLPGICFDFSRNQTLTRPQIQNSDKLINARIISARQPNEKMKNFFLPGETYYFSGTIKILEDKNK